MSKKSRRILAATVPESVAALETVYGKYFDIVIVTRLADAVAQLDNGADLILCNIHFDEGALYDLLRIVKAHKTARSLPFFAIDASLSPSSPAIRQSIDIASKALGADEVIHMAKWRDELGEIEAIQKVFDLVVEYVETQIHKR